MDSILRKRSQASPSDRSVLAMMTEIASILGQRFGVPFTALHIQQHVSRSIQTRGMLWLQYRLRLLHYRYHYQAQASKTLLQSSTKCPKSLRLLRRRQSSGWYNKLPHWRSSESGSRRRISRSRKQIKIPSSGYCRDYRKQQCKMMKSM